MSGNCSGHTLIELMIAMTLSILVVAALMPISTITLQSVLNVRQIETRANRLHQSITLLESDLKSTALTGCASEKSLVIDSLSHQPMRIIRLSEFQWLSGYSNNHWFPQDPVFATRLDAGSHDALQLVKADVSRQLSTADVTSTPQQVVFITNCLHSEITRAINATLIDNTNLYAVPTIHPLQFIEYFVKDNTGTKTLYRKYLSRSGITVSEPLVDEIDQFRIAYGETSNSKTIKFKPAANVNDWNKIAAVYVTISLSDKLNNATVSTIVPLINHAHE